MQPSTSQRSAGSLVAGRLCPRHEEVGEGAAERADRDHPHAHATADAMAPWQPWQGKRFPRPWDAAAAAGGA